MNLRFIPSGSDQMNRMRIADASSSRRSDSHKATVNSAVRSGWVNSRATVCMPSEMNTSRNCPGSASRRRVRISSCWASSGFGSVN